MTIAKNLSKQLRLVRSRVRSRIRRPRRGSALILTLVLTMSLASIATSAIYLGSNSGMLASTYDQERNLRYAAEAMLQMGKSTLNYDPYASPDTGYTTVKSNVAINGADGLPIQGVTASMYIGPTSSNTGQFGRFVSVVSVAKNSVGAQVIRRLELAQESFAKFAYWSNQETNSGSIIYFNNNDQLWGPVWSNDVLHIGSGGARFHGDVGTAKTIDGPGYGTFDKGYTENGHAIALPNNTQLGSLAGFAAAGSLSFNAPTNGDISQTAMRIEFVAKPYNGGAGGGATGLPINGADDGFLRVYVSAGTAARAHWVRGDSSDANCGAAYTFKPGTKPMFVPISEHKTEWFKNALTASTIYTPSTINNLTTSGNWRQNILQQTSSRCYLGGDPNLRVVSMHAEHTTYPADSIKGKTSVIPDTLIAVAMRLAGNDTTFFPGTASDSMGHWIAYPGGVTPALAAIWPTEAPYLYPLYRGLNSGTKGVIYVNGTTGISGTLRGKVTLYATGSVAILRDTKYVTDPSLNLCSDILGVISGHDILVADNAPQTPLNTGSPVGWKNMDDTKDVFLQGVLMALNTAFGAEDFDQGPQNANDCETTNNGRGCLYLTGGIIQQQRGAVGLSSGEGYAKRYIYDQCALYNPPPYFPTTGRYTDNRYYEIDPNGFNIAGLFHSLTPGP